MENELLSLKLHEELIINDYLRIQKVWGGFMYCYVNIIEHSIGENREFHYNKIFVPM